jgi:cell wall-associated NlpC family hydrolase
VGFAFFGYAGLRWGMDELKKIESRGLGLPRPAFTATIMALGIVLAGCSTAPPVPNSHAGAALSSRLTSEQSDDVTLYAIGLVGTPYRYGGNTPASGFDCSGLIGHVYTTRAGVAPPRTVSRLQNWGQGVLNDDVRTGDLVIFGQRDSANHAGIYVGGGRFVHAPSTGGAVRLDNLNSAYWASQQVAFRRP